MNPPMPDDPGGTERLQGGHTRMTSVSSMTFVDTMLSSAMRLVGRLLLWVMVCWLALLGLALGVVLLVWSSLRGRRPTLRFQLGSQAMDWQRFRRGPATQRPAPGAAPGRAAGDVIEGQARELP